MKVINIIAHDHSPDIIYKEDDSVWVSVKESDTVFISGVINSNGSQQSETMLNVNGEVQILSSKELPYQLNITKV